MSNFWKSDLEVGYYDKILDKGLKHSRGLQAGWHNITFLKLKKFVEKNTAHLDYACGSGSFIGKYLEGQSLGIDLSEIQINYAKEKYGQNGEFKTIDEFNFADYEDYFDLITVAGLLEFIDIKEAENLIVDLKKTLNRNGKIILTTPNYGGAFGFLQKIVYLFSDVNYDNELKTKYNLELIQSLNLENHFERVSIKKIITIGWFFSLFSFDLGIKVNNFIESLTNNKFGYLLLIELNKEI